MIFSIDFDNKGEIIIVENGSIIRPIVFKAAHFLELLWNLKFVINKFLFLFLCLVL